MSTGKIKSLFFTVTFHLTTPSSRAVDGNDRIRALTKRLAGYLATDVVEAVEETTDEGDTVATAITVELFASELETASALIQVEFDVARVTVDATTMRRF